jgi:hypothetical protein
MRNFINTTFKKPKNQKTFGFPSGFFKKKFSKKMNCPPAPHKNRILTYNHITSEWEHLPKKVEPVPKNNTIVEVYDYINQKWVIHR